MSKYETAIVMDSGGDLPFDLCEKEGIEFLPLHVIYPENDYYDGIDIDPMMIYNRFPGEIPSTSTPSLGEVHALLSSLRDKGVKNVIAVAISSHLSSTGNTIAMAAKDFEDLNVYVYNTRNISFGSGIFALWAARKRAQGWSYEQLIEGLEKKNQDSRIFFYMDTLKYLRHGGRIGLVASFVGEMLHIKPIISCNPEGVYYTVAKIRGSRNGKNRLIEEAVNVAGNKKCWIIVGEGAAHEEALKLETMVKDALPNAEILFTKQITATLANNTGPGLLGLEVFVEP